MEKTYNPLFTAEQLARMGGGVLGYIREIEPQQAKAFLGENMALPPKTKLFCLYNADGSPVSISSTREAAVGSAFEHELIPTSLH